RPSPPLSMQSSDQLYSSAFDSGVNAANADLDLDIEFFNQLTDETANAPPPPFRSFDANLLSSNLSSILSSPNITNNNNNRGPLAVSTSFPQPTTSFHPHSPFPASPLHANNSIEFEQFRSASRHAIQVILAASSPRPPATPQIRNSFDKPIEFAPFATSSQFTPSTPVAPVSSAVAVAVLSEAATSVFGTPNFNHQQQQQQQQQSYRMIASPMISNVQHFQHASIPLSPMIPTLHPMASVESLEAMTAHRLSDLSQGYSFDANQQQHHNHANDQDFQYGHYSIIEGSKQECTTQDDHHTHINNANDISNTHVITNNNKVNNTSSSPLIDSSKSVHNIPITAIRTDTGKSLFICPWEGCQRQFTRPYNLRSHYRQHTGERPFACTQCSLSFSRHHDLKRHTLIHAPGGKQHACPACNRSFLRSDALKRHLKPNGDDSKLSKCLYIIHDRQLPLVSLDPSFLQSSLGRLKAGRRGVGGGVSDQEEEEEEEGDEE
ncbi:Metallothionein expression activator, partial [Chytriomyces hyalinus]